MERDEIKKESQNLLEVEHLSVTFNQYSMGTERRSLEVIHDISLSVKSGEIVAVIGASGSGKSLLAHAIMGILPVNAVTKGNVIFEGKVLSEKDKENLRGKKIALIPQSVSYLDPMMTVKNQIESPLKRRDSKKGIVQSLMEKFQLKKEVATQYPFELSAGSTTVIKNCFVTKYCLVDPYICVEGISTADAFITDEEKENCVVAYYVVDTESDSIEGPFAIFQEMAERFDYIHIPPIEAWQEPKHPDQR